MKWKHGLIVVMVTLCLALATPAVAAKVVNVNTATVAQLEHVKGIGAALAKRIVEYRKIHGTFKSLDGLTHVKGIGKKTLDHFRDALTVGKTG